MGKPRATHIKSTKSQHILTDFLPKFYDLEGNEIPQQQFELEQFLRINQYLQAIEDRKQNRKKAG